MHQRSAGRAETKGGSLEVVGLGCSGSSPILEAAV